MSTAVDEAYAALERLQQDYNVAERQFYSLRYKFWQAIAAVKKLSPLTESYKTFEGRVRRDCKRRQRRGYYGKRPRGKQLDHIMPILYYYCVGIDDLDTINGRDNTAWIARAENRIKGICRGE